MQWMEEAGVRPSTQMYQNILSFAQIRSGTEHGAVIKERIGKFLKYHFLRMLSWGIVIEGFGCF